MHEKFRKLNHNYFILPVISGLLLSLTLPPFDIGVFAWFALTPLFFFIIETKLSTKKIFQAGLVTGIVYFGKVTYPLFSLNAWWWLQVQSVVYANRYLFLFWLLYVAVFVASVFWGVFALFFRKLLLKKKIAVLVLPLVWIIFEYVRSSLLFGFTWGNSGYALHKDIFLMQLAHDFGVYGLSFIVVLVNILIFFFIYEIIQIYKHSSNIKSALWKVVQLPVFYIIIITVTVPHLYGFIEFQQVTRTLAVQHHSTLSFSILQSGNEPESTTFRKLSQVLMQRSDVIVLPESALPSIIFNEDSPTPISQVRSEAPQDKDLATLLALSRTYPDTTIVAGIDSTKQQSDYSSIIVIEAGQVIDTYHKRILMPFSERSVAAPLLETTNSLHAGTSNGIKIKHWSVSALICSEILFPNLLENDSTSTSFVIAVGNDGVFDNSTVAEQNNIIAQFDAVLTRKYLVSAMKTGVSGIIDPIGRVVLQSSPTKESQTLSGVINLPLTQ